MNMLRPEGRIIQGSMPVQLRTTGYKGQGVRSAKVSVPTQKNEKQKYRIPTALTMPALTNEVVTRFLSFLGSYPEYDAGDLAALQGYPEARRVADAFTARDISAVAPEDFLRISTDGAFLLSCGVYLLIYGMRHADPSSTRLAVGLFEIARVHIGRGADVARALINESTARLTLAEMGEDTLYNLERARDLNRRAREGGFPTGSQDFALALLNEAILRTILAERDMDVQENLEQALLLAEEASRSGFVRNSPLFGKALMTQGDSHARLAGMGKDPMTHFAQAVGLLEQARHEGLLKNTPEYLRDLVLEGDTRLLMADADIDPIDNRAKAKKLYREALKSPFILSDDARRLRALLEK
ncbi:MAG: hypothetical protein LUQ13_01335 [Methanomicrobiales archaeon]|nr:hypothetical protein [Methanomicrobiales archaeon]